jgi:hypothetical protein|tara:strand:+ start:709 stop:1527 length:819 start_codon:yes stop_codon:yes gene_type:complete
MRIENVKTKKWPLITHGNGPSSESSLYKKIKKVFFKSVHEMQNIPKELSIITWSIPNEKYILGECMEKLGCKDGLHVIPFTKPFEWTGKVTKTLEYLKYIETPYVMGLDALDVIPSTDEGNLWEEILNHFKEMNVDILYNAESSSWPDKEFGTSLPENHPLMYRLNKCKDIEETVYRDMLNSNRCYLNSGCWIAKTSDMIKFYTSVYNLIEEYPESKKDENYFGGEQGFVRAIMPDFFPSIRLDYNSTIIQTLVGVEDDDINVHITQPRTNV